VALVSRSESDAKAKLLAIDEHHDRGGWLMRMVSKGSQDPHLYGSFCHATSSAAR
jgi:hypothetical protein